MSKKTIRKKVLEDLKVSFVFNEDADGSNKRVKMVLPDIVKERWRFRSDREEAAFAGFASAIANEFVCFGLSREEVSKRFVTLIQRTVKAGLMQRKENSGSE